MEIDIIKVVLTKMKHFNTHLALDKSINQEFKQIYSSKFAAMGLIY